LELQENAVLKFSPEPRYYLPMVKTGWEGTFLQNYSPFIYGYQLHDVSIIGKGTIDGNASTTFSTWKPNQKRGQQLSREMNHQEIPIAERNFGEGYWLRPHLVQFFQCKNITIEGVFITNAPFWCVHLLQSENIICRGIRYDAKLVNNDGIDPEYSRNILIEDVYFNNGDDNVAIKCGRDNDGWKTAIPSENIIIRNCHFKGLHAVVIGSEMSAGVRNVFIENCDYAGYCKRGIYVKTNPDRGGFVRDIYVNNCVFDEVEDLFYVTSMYAGEGAESKHFSTVENIFVDGLRCNKARAAGIALQGTKAKPLRNISFRNVEIGEVKNAVSMDDTEDIIFQNCHFGGKAGVPTQVTPKDHLFQ
jgi:polygalacturonase